jgi:hypothetical protein
MFAGVFLQVHVSCHFAFVRTRSGIRRASLIGAELDSLCVPPSPFNRPIGTADTVHGRSLDGDQQTISLRSEEAIAKYIH